MHQCLRSAWLQLKKKPSAKCSTWSHTPSALWSSVRALTRQGYTHCQPDFHLSPEHWRWPASMRQNTARDEKKAPGATVCHRDVLGQRIGAQWWWTPWDMCCWGNYVSFHKQNQALSGHVATLEFPVSLGKRLAKKFPGIWAPERVKG